MACAGILTLTATHRDHASASAACFLILRIIDDARRISHAGDAAGNVVDAILRQFEHPTWRFTRDKLEPAYGARRGVNHYHFGHPIPQGKCALNAPNLQAATALMLL